MSGPERKAQIVDVVLRLVHEHGVEGTTTARIARAAGVTEPTLYQYFESRREMLLAALDVVFERATEVVDSSHEGDAVERLRKIGEYHTRETKAKQLALRRSAVRVRRGSAGDGAARSGPRAATSASVDSLAAIVEEGKAQGRIRPDVDAKRVAWRVMGFYWFEDVSSLMDLGEVVDEGISTEMLDGHPRGHHHGLRSSWAKWASWVSGRWDRACRARLLAAGHEVTVWNRTGEKTLPLLRQRGGGRGHARRSRLRQGHRAGEPHRRGRLCAASSPDRAASLRPTRCLRYSSIWPPSLPANQRR